MEGRDAITGHRDDEAYLVVRDREWVSESAQKVTDATTFSLRFLPDTNEIVLVKQVSGVEDEAVYSELLSD